MIPLDLITEHLITIHISGEKKTGWAEGVLALQNLHWGTEPPDSSKRAQGKEACLCIIACIPTDGLQPTHCYFAVSYPAYFSRI